MTSQSPSGESLVFLEQVDLQRGDRETDTPTDSGQTTYTSRTLTHNLQPPAQETKPLISNSQPRKPATRLYGQPRKLTVTFATVGPTWPGFDQ